MLSVLKIAFFSSIQDTGRVGVQKYGVPFSGAMDQHSYQLGNHILGNSNDCASIEFSLPGSKLQFEQDTNIAITGADFEPKINNSLIDINRSISIKKGDILTFEKQNLGTRCYLAVTDGFNTEVIFDSRSMYQNITTKTSIIKADLIPYTPSKSIDLNAKIKKDNQYFSEQNIEVFKGPEFDLLPKKSKQSLTSKAFTISKTNNRMAYQLIEPLPNELVPIITSPVLPGTVQLTPSGQLIILMRDCQTTGGYPRVLQLSEKAISTLSQKKEGDIISFKII